MSCYGLDGIMHFSQFHDFGTKPKNAIRVNYSIHVPMLTNEIDVT